MNVLLIDDHQMVNSGIKAMLEETGHFNVIGEAVTLKEAVNFIEISINDIFPSLIILDIMLGEENGLDFLPYIKNFCINKQIKKPAVLVCSVIEEPFRIQSALDMGASGYISKASSKTELLQAINNVLLGKTYISGEHSVKVKECCSLYSKFTNREAEIFNLLKNNRSNKQTADLLGLSIRTIENHIGNIYYKTGTKNKDELLKL